MRRIPTLFALLVVALTAPQAHAAIAPPAEAPAASVTPRVVQSTPATGELRLAKVQVEERATAADATVAQMPARGSFWWLVGVVVVAGVILAVVL